MREECDVIWKPQQSLRIRMSLQMPMDRFLRMFCVRTQIECYPQKNFKIFLSSELGDWTYGYSSWCGSMSRHKATSLSSAFSWLFNQRAHRSSSKGRKAVATCMVSAGTVRSWDRVSRRVPGKEACTIAAAYGDSGEICEINDRDCRAKLMVSGSWNVILQKDYPW
jgi:hypothetical protein